MAEVKYEGVHVKFTPDQKRLMRSLSIQREMTPADFARESVLCVMRQQVRGGEFEVDPADAEVLGLTEEDRQRGITARLLARRKALRAELEELESHLPEDDKQVKVDNILGKRLAVEDDGFDEVSTDG